MQSPLQVKDVCSPDLHRIKYELRDELLQEFSETLHDTLYLEFGVMEGMSLNDFYDVYTKYKVRNVDFYGFDSWEGLPKEEKDSNFQSNWTQGAFKGTIKEEYAVKLLPLPNVHIVDGWFKDTLTEELYNKFNNKKVGIVHIDCDIYSSTIEALEFLIQHNLLQVDSLIIYDDWGGYQEKLGPGHDFDCGEGRAHKEMMEKYNIETTFLTKYILINPIYEIAVFKVVSLG